MRKSLGDKRKEISAGADRRDHPPLRRIHRERAVKVFPNAAFGYQRITVERPLQTALGGEPRHASGTWSETKAWAKS